MRLRIFPLRETNQRYARPTSDGRHVVTMKPRARRQLIAGGLVAGALAVGGPAVVSGHSSSGPPGVPLLPPPLPDPGSGSGKPSSSPEPSPTGPPGGRNLPH